LYFGIQSRIMAEIQSFHPLAGEFELLALAFDESQNSEQRQDMLTRMKAVIDELDERILQEAIPPATFR
jgi:hypothetical protein